MGVGAGADTEFPCSQSSRACSLEEGREERQGEAGRKVVAVSRRRWGEGTNRHSLLPKGKDGASLPCPFLSPLQPEGKELRNGVSAGLATRVRGGYTSSPWPPCALHLVRKRNVGAKGSTEVWGPSLLQRGREKWFPRAAGVATVLGETPGHEGVMCGCHFGRSHPLPKVPPGTPGGTQPLPLSLLRKDALWPSGYQRINVLC